MGLYLGVFTPPLSSAVDSGGRGRVALGLGEGGQEQEHFWLRKILTLLRGPGWGGGRTVGEWGEAGEFLFKVILTLFKYTFMGTQFVSKVKSDLAFLS